MYHQQQKKKSTTIGVNLPISKLHSILAVANLLAHNKWVMLLWWSKIVIAKIKCSFEMGK